MNEECVLDSWNERYICAKRMVVRRCLEYGRWVYHTSNWLHGLQCLAALCFLNTFAAPPLKIVVQINKDDWSHICLDVGQHYDSNPIECIESFVTQKFSDIFSKSRIFDTTFF